MVIGEVVSSSPGSVVYREVPETGITLAAAAIPVEVGPLPWHIEYGNAECDDDQWAVVQDSDGSVAGCHPTRADAVSQMQALYANDPQLPDGAELVAAAMSNDGADTGAMIAFVPTAEDAARLALDGYEPADQLHCTSAYLGDAAALDPTMRQQIVEAATQAASQIAPFEAEAFASSTFNPNGDQPALVFSLSGDGIADAQDAMPPELAGGTDNHRPHHPHITLAYDSDPDLLRGPELNARLGPVKFDRLRVAFAGDVTDIPLSGGNPQGVDEPVDEEIPLTAAADIPPGPGTPWTAVLVPEGVWSGDGRQFAPDSLTWAPLPLPLKWQPSEEEGHEGSVISGRIDTIERDGSLIRATGVFDDAGVNGAEALRLVRAMMLRGISICADDVDQTDIELIFEMPEAPPVPPEVEQIQQIADASPELDVVIDMPEPEIEEPCAPPKQLYHAGRIRSATLVAEAAWIESELMLGEPETMAPTRVEMPLTAAGGGWTITIPELWPEDWFNEPAPEDMPEFGGLRITASGRITGYIAPPGVVHRAYRPSGRPLTVPLNQDYSEFNNKPALVAAADGSVARINAGTITFNCGHPDIQDPRRAGGPSAVREMYDNSCSVFARVRVWESRRYPGTAIVAGALLHGVDADALERAMGCHLSGDWQGGKFNAALLVPNEGFPPSVAGSVRVREGQLVASSVPIAFEPRAKDQLEILARRIGMDRASQFARLRARVGGE